MKFHLEDDSLTITFEGAEQFWALKRKLIVPKASIKHVDWSESFAMHRRELGWRIGTSIPGWLFAGRFISKQGENFVYLQQPKGLLGDIEARHVLTVDLLDHSYKRLFITVNDPDIAGQIVVWWSSAT
jgi:hypothetical protein